MGKTRKKMKIFRKENEIDNNESLKNSRKYYSHQDLRAGSACPGNNTYGGTPGNLPRTNSSNSLASQVSEISTGTSISQFSFSGSLTNRRHTETDLKIPEKFLRHNSTSGVLNTNFTRGSSNRISRRNSTKKNRDSNSSNRLSGMSFDGEIIPEDRDVPIPPKRSNSSVSDLPTIPGEGNFEEIVHIPKKSYSVVNLSQPEKRNAATLPRKTSTAKGVSREWHKEYPETYENIKHDKKEVIRQNIILEICNSHFDFYEDLIHVKKVYVRGLELFGKLDSQTIASLFGNLNEVIQVNDGLEDELKLLRDERGIINHIGGALRSWVPKLSCYAEYAKGLVLKRKRLEDCFKEEKVQAFLATAEQAKFARKLTIWSFLDAPRSNLPRLKLQLERLLKHTPEGNEDLIILPEVISKLDEQIKKLNDSIAAAEFQSIVSTLTFKNQTENNIPFGATQLFYKGNVKFKHKDMELLLFDTCWAISRMKGKTEREIVKCEKLSTSNLLHPTRFESRLQMTRDGGQKMLLLAAQNPTDASTWADEFAKAKSRYLDILAEQSVIEHLHNGGDPENDETDSINEVPQVPKRLREAPKSERPSSWVSKFWSRSGDKSEPESPKVPRRKTIDVADKSSTDAIDKALANTAKEYLKGSMVNLSDNLIGTDSGSIQDFSIGTEDNISTDDSSSKIFSFDAASIRSDKSEQKTTNGCTRSTSAVSGTSFASSDSDGFVSANMTRRTAIYQKPVVDACEDEPIDGPVSISISDRTQTTENEHVRDPEHKSVPELPARIPSTSDSVPPKLPPRPSRTEPRDFNVIAEQEPEMGPETLEIPKHYQTMEKPEPKTRNRTRSAQSENRNSSQSECEGDDQSENESPDEQDYDSFEAPDSFDSGHPTSPSRGQNDVDEDYLKSLENGVQTPRSLALSEMGSEVDVDQSLNISSFAIATNTEMNCNGITATDFQEITDVTDLSRAIVSETIEHARVEVSVNHVTLNDLNDRSDSGTDSFSEQMEDELDALACSIVGRAIGLVKTELSLPPIP